MQNFKSSATTVTLLHEEDEETMKILFTCVSYLVMFSSIFLHAVTFLHVLRLDILRRQIETESKDKNFLMYGYNTGPPIAIPIYTVLPYCVIRQYRQEEVKARSVRADACLCSNI